MSVSLSFPLEFPSRAAACGRLRSVRKATTDGATVATVAAENVVNEACMELVMAKANLCSTHGVCATRG